MANHASHAALPFPVKKARYTILVPYLDADGDPTDPTTPDTEVSKDGGAFADCAEEVTTISGSNGMGYLTLTGAELDASVVGVAAKVASGPKATLALLTPRVLPIIAQGTAQAGAAGSITLASGASAVDGAYTGCIVRTTGGTGGGGTGGANNQARVVTGYTGSTKVATVEPNWETNPGNDTTYDLLATEMATVPLPIGDLDAEVDTLVGRLTATRATNLDQLHDLHDGLDNVSTIKSVLQNATYGLQALYNVLTTAGVKVASIANAAISAATFAANALDAVWSAVTRELTTAPATSTDVRDWLAIHLEKTDHRFRYLLAKDLKGIIGTVLAGTTVAWHDEAGQPVTPLEGWWIDIVASTVGWGTDFTDLGWGSQFISGGTTMYPEKKLGRLDANGWTPELYPEGHEKAAQPVTVNGAMVYFDQNPDNTGTPTVHLVTTNWTADLSPCHGGCCCFFLNDGTPLNNQNMLITNGPLVRPPLLLSEIEGSTKLARQDQTKGLDNTYDKVATLEARLTAERGLLLDNLTRLDASISSIAAPEITVDAAPLLAAGLASDASIQALRTQLQIAIATGAAAVAGPGDAGGARYIEAVLNQIWIDLRDPNHNAYTADVMRGAFNRAAQEVADVLVNIGAEVAQRSLTIVGDGVHQDYALPGDFRAFVPETVQPRIPRTALTNFERGRFLRHMGPHAIKVTPTGTADPTAFCLVTTEEGQFIRFERVLPAGTFIDARYLPLPPFYGPEVDLGKTRMPWLGLLDPLLQRTTELYLREGLEFTVEARALWRARAEAEAIGLLGLRHRQVRVSNPSIWSGIRPR
jgi:hypothetical protein